ncbi:hypothetical protein K7432_013179 [Basidiobolus ranarum]|uniref:Uncharacterized protein n=1 Tax=Basidiobolus ranarum TaxID=34480 RepID=A0ABR2WJL4_9FUNG
MAVKSDVLAKTPRVTADVKKQNTVYTRTDDINTPTQKKIRFSQDVRQPISQSIYSSCSTVCAEDSRTMTGFERIMAAAGSDTEMKLMSFINDYSDFVPTPSLMAGSSDDEPFELNSKTGTRAPKVYFSPPPKGYVSHKDPNSSKLKHQYTPKLSSSKSGICFDKVCPDSTPHKRVSLLSKMLQSSDSEGNESEDTTSPKRSVKSGRKSIGFCLPNEIHYEQALADKKKHPTLPVRGTRIPGQRYQGYFDETVQIW